MTEVYDIIESIKSEVNDRLREELGDKKFKTEEEFKDACFEYEDDVIEWGKDEIEGCLEDEEELIYNYGIQNALDIAGDTSDVNSIAHDIVERDWEDEDARDLIDDFVYDNWCDYEYGDEEKILDEVEKIVESSLEVLKIMGESGSTTRKYGYYNSIISAISDLEADYAFSQDDKDRLLAWKDQLCRAYTGVEEQPSSSDSQSVAEPQSTEVN